MGGNIRKVLDLGGNVEDKVEGAGGVYFVSFTFFHPWTLFFKYVLL